MVYVFLGPVTRKWSARAHPVVVVAVRRTVSRDVTGWRLISRTIEEATQTAHHIFVGFCRRRRFSSLARLVAGLSVCVRWRWTRIRLLASRVIHEVAVFT